VALEVELNNVEKPETVTEKFVTAETEKVQLKLKLKLRLKRSLQLKSHRFPNKMTSRLQ